MKIIEGDIIFNRTSHFVNILNYKYCTIHLMILISVKFDFSLYTTLTYMRC